MGEDQHPDENGTGLKAELYGDLAHVLAFCENAELQKKKPAVESAGCQLSVVAGARNCLNLLLSVRGIETGATTS